VTARRFALPGFRGEVAESFAVADPAAEAARLADPASATKTLHWGRNYLYLARVATAEGPLDVVVKQFREAGWLARLGRRLRGGESKAAKSWRMARALAAAGIATPEALLLLEAERAGGASIFVCRYLPDRVEARYLLRARHAGREREEYPGLAFDAFLDAAAALARRLHDAGFWHRDFSIGNLLLRAPEVAGAPPAIAVVDLNRCRAGREVTRAQRMRDLARLKLDFAADRRRLLAAYFGGDQAVPAGAELVYEAARIGFHGRHRVKNRLRGSWNALRSWLVPRGTHPTFRRRLPAPRCATASSGTRSPTNRTRTPGGSVARAPASATSATICAARGARRRPAAHPPAPARARAARNREPFAWPGVGVALRPAAERIPRRCSRGSSTSASGRR
jgi:hypothetical protein